MGFCTLLSTDKCYRFGATLTTAVSGVITPAGSAQFSGYASRTKIPKYTCTLPAGGIDPGYRLVLSETERSLPVRNQFGFSHPTLDSQMLHIRHHSNTAVSGVTTPAGSAQFSGYASRFTIPKYTCTLPAGGIDPGYRLVLSETERSLPVCNHFGFYIQIERIVPRRGTN